MHRTLALLLLTAAIAAPSMGAVFLVPEDAELVRESHVIVVGSVTLLQTRVGDDGTIETVVTIEVEESIKGGLPVKGRFQLIEEGGFLANRAVIVSGSPRYWPGQRALIFVDRQVRGTSTSAPRMRTYGMMLGKFDFVTDLRGRRLLARGVSGEGELFGFDSSGARHVERLRSAARFLAYVRKVAAGLAPPVDYFLDEEEEREIRLVPRKVAAAHVPSGAGSVPSVRLMTIGADAITATSHYPPSAYLMGPLRWAVFDAGGSASYRVSGSQPGYDSTGAAQRGLAAWTNDPSSNISILYGGTTTAGFVEDGISAIVFNSSTDVPAGAIGYSRAFAGAQHTYKGETFYSITEGDVVMRSNLSLSQKAFDEAVTHELGHTLGLRHSNEGTPASSNAVMNSVVTGAWGASLGPWDQEAATHVYGSGTVTPPPSCTPPSITAQPQSTTITQGQSVTLSVTATGSATLLYQWYFGSSGDTNVPIAGATASSLTVTPSATQTYWVRVFNGCGSVNSSTVTVTVTLPAQPTASSFYLVTPCRVLDTRNPNGTYGGPAISAGGTRVFPLAGVCGIPSDATSVSLNVTVVPPVQSGYLTIYPADVPAPPTSTINYAQVKIRANNAIIRVSNDGRAALAIFAGGTASVHVIVDVNGYFK